MELSNALESARQDAALATSAVASTSAGTLPGPTPSDGLPERYAARTTAVPPVATITSTPRSPISASISGIVGSSTTWRHPSGAPADTAACARTPTASTETLRARGWGETTTALRVISARITLK